MVTVPAFVWRFGPIQRALILGLGIGVCLGTLAWIDSGFLLAGLIVLVMSSLFYGVWMARRTARLWPSAKQLNAAERERVARAARGGESIDDPRLGLALADYRNGLHEAAESARPFRWLLWFVLVVAVGSAVWDATSGSWGNTIASVIYLVILVLEMFWWPKRQRQLLTNSDRAMEMTREGA
jgi:hypothetical protein